MRPALQRIPPEKEAAKILQQHVSFTCELYEHTSHISYVRKLILMIGLCDGHNEM
jgi:hypothetical protein